MAFFLDSASPSEAQEAAQLGWVRGITTNPGLLAHSQLPPAETLRALAAAIPGEVFYQLIAPELAGMLAEAQLARAVLGKQLVLKIPATLPGFQAVARLSVTTPCAVTAIFSPAQAIVAAAAGASYVIPYVNRSTRLLGDGPGLVREMATVLAKTHTEILAASVKSAQEAALALKAGSHHLTLPLQVLISMAEHDFSAQTVADFQRTGRGLG